MIKAVIFDCFGVLTTDGWKQIREEYFAHDEKLLQHSFDIDRAVNAGMMEYDDFIAEISHTTGLSIAEVSRRLNGSAPNNMLFEFIRDALKKDYKIGLLSNAAANWLDELFEPWQVELFDETVLSFEAGTVKPDPRMYQMITNKLGVTPGECLFIDDSERYCTAAEELGIIGIYHQDTHDTIAKIKERLHA